MLGTPPAFVLSQDQTLEFKSWSSISSRSFTFNYLALMISHLNLRSTLSGCTASAASSLSSKESRFVFFTLHYIVFKVRVRFVRNEIYLIKNSRLAQFLFQPFLIVYHSLFNLYSFIFIFLFVFNSISYFLRFSSVFILYIFYAHILFKPHSNPCRHRQNQQ